MKTKFNHITRRQIDRYKTAGSAEQYQLEREMDNFDQDALDGWTESGLTTAHGMKKTDHKFLRPSVKYLYFAGAGMIVVAGLVIFLSQKKAIPHEGKKETLITKVETTEIVLPEKIDTLTELPLTQQLRIVTVQTEQKHISESEINEPKTIPATNSPAVVDVPKLPEKPISEKPVSGTVRKNAAEIYLSDLKLVDYTKYRSKPVIPVERIIITGTPADQEDNTSEISTTKETIDIPYIEYIAKTAKLVSKERWKDALQRLEVILQNYPDDINAHFYAGICAYNLQLSEKAIEHFRYCELSTFDNFSQESQWYEAKALLLTDKQAAVQLLKKIVEQNGFYTTQAKKLLKQIQ